MQDDRVQVISNGQHSKGLTPSASTPALIIDTGATEEQVHVPPPPIHANPEQSSYTQCTRTQQTLPYMIPSCSSYTHIAHQPQASPLQMNKTPLYTRNTPTTVYQI